MWETARPGMKSPAPLGTRVGRDHEYLCGDGVFRRDTGRKTAVIGSRIRAVGNGGKGGGHVQ